MDRYYEYTDRLGSPLEAFSHITNGENFPILPHWHYFIEMIYLTKGRTLATCGDAVFAMEPGDVLFFPPKALHTIDYLPKGSEGLHGYLPDLRAEDCPLITRPKEPIPNQAHGAIHPVSKLQIKSDPPSDTDNVCYDVLKFDLGFLQATENMKNQFSEIMKLAFANDPSCIFFPKGTLSDIHPRKLFRDCVAEMRHHRFGYDTVVCAKLALLMTGFTRQWITQGINVEELFLSKEKDNQEFNCIADYIKTHYNEPLRIQDLAERCGMSYSYFAKLFRETYHQSCKEYIEFIRINKVTDLLLFTKLDLTYISQETGFSDCSHLIRTFRKWKGCTPRQWMKSYRSQVSTEQ